MALLSKRLLIVTGKGGVGKSTVAAALALRSAEAGTRTLVCEVNAKERISQLLGKAEVGGAITALEPNLWAINVNPPEALREYALMTLRFESIYNAVFENRLVRYFLRFIPSLQELVMLGKILFHAREQRPDGSLKYERVIIDAPATGHALTFLSVPQVLLDTVPPGPMAREAKVMRDLLVDAQNTAAVLVALPEELPVNETIELGTALRERLRLQPAAVVLNGCIAPRFRDEDLEQLRTSRELERIARAHEERAARCSASQKKLVEGLGLTVQPLPRLFHPSFNRKSVDELGSVLAPLLEGGASALAVER
jgi:anion-transporting  ArsA/GET3 family ATPase